MALRNGGRVATLVQHDDVTVCSLCENVVYPGEPMCVCCGATVHYDDDQLVPDLEV